MKNDNNRLIKRIYTKKTINKMNKKERLLGIYYNYDVIDLLNYRLLITAFLLFIFLVTNDLGYIYGPLSAILFYIFSEYFFFDFRIKRREKKLNNEALFFFEVLTLTLESGRNLKKALDLTVQNVSGEISDEFKKTLSDVKLGKSLTEALKDMKSRIPSDTINTVILNIIQSNEFGNSIVESLNNQVDFLREKKLQEIKSQIGKLPVKISVISVIFFIPIMLLMVLVPVILTYIVS